MGVVKNLIVRIGADASGVVSGMKTASNATVKMRDTLKESSTDIKNSASGSFKSVGQSIRSYAATVSKTKQDHQVAVQGIEVLSDKIAQMEATYNTIRSATAGLDLSKPLAELRVDAEKSLTAIESRSRKVEAELKRLGTGKSKANRTESLQAELKSLAEKARFAQARLQDLDRIAELVGDENIGSASTAGLQRMQNEITAAKNELKTLEMVAGETDRKLKSLGLAPTLGRMLKSAGTAAAQAAGNGVRKLGNGLKSLAGGAVRGIASIPGKLLKIGKSASSSCGGLTKMVRSIRNIGIASLGMRIASGMFGKLRSIISSYISQNEELNASVTAMKNQMGEALAPAINIVLAAMQRLMPVITAVSNGINSILAALFGNISSVSSAVKSTTEEAASAAESLDTYGFDQITKVSDNSDNSSSGGSAASQSAQSGEQSALVQKLTGWIKQLKGAFVAGDWKGLGKLVGDGINSAFAAIDAVDVGTKIGTFANNLATTLHSAFTTIDFMGIGQTAAQMLNSAIEQIDWAMVGETIGAALLALPSILVGFILETDWASVGQSASECVKSALSTISTWIQQTDWMQIGKSAADLIMNIDWWGIASSLYSLLGSALGATASVLWGFIDTAVASIGEYFTTKIDECGGNVAEGLWKGICDGIVALGEKYYTSVIQPFAEGFSGAFEGAWTGMKEWLNKIIGGVESMINTIIRGINGMIEAFNKVAAVGEYIGIDLQFGTIAEKTLPRLAKGGIVDGPTALIAGEQGKEAIMPLENNTGWIDKLARRLSVKQSGGENSGQPVIIQVFLGKRKLTEYVIQDINQITRTTGVCPIHC